MSKEYHVGVDVTHSVWVTVVADTQEQAEALAKEEADGYVAEGAWVKSEVHFIDEVGEVTV